jgi:crotonobetainyl-CoA:carnitine CoA-transferase CaiB-like acyl-CoA transferase
MPLEGIRVIELAVYGVGPIAAMMLADLGAEVIKIEEPVGGDLSRGAVRFQGVELQKRVGDHSVALLYEACNRNKKSITLDVRTEKGREVVYRLAARSDVFVQNLSPGSVTRLGVDYETLSRYNPRLIYGTGSGYGREGPDRMEPAQDTAGNARAGMMFACDPNGPPTYLLGVVGDVMTATMLAYAILVALLVRERTGIGQAVESSQLGSLIWLQYLKVFTYNVTGREFQAAIREKAENPLVNWYKCQDGKWLALGSFQADKFWSDHCKVLGIEELEKDPRFENINVRAKNCEELIAILDKVFATKPREEWLRLLRQAPSGIVCTPVNTVPDLASDPQVLANEFITTLEHSILGTIKVPGIPVQFSRTPGAVRSQAPEFGQHTEEVLLDICGYTWDEIQAMREQAVI